MPRRNKNSKRQGRRPQADLPLGNRLTAFSPGTPAMRLAVEIFVGKLTTTVTSGQISSSTAIQAALMANFGGRFVAFDEYMIEKVMFKVDCCSQNNPGLINMWCEPVASATGAPNSTDAKQNKTVTFPAGDTSKTHVMKYNPNNAVTQAWTPVSNTTAVCGNFKIYTNNADFGSTTVATDYVVVTGTIWVAFRGFG